MTVSEAVTFGSLLRRHRLAVSLSQEALAERAGLSAATIAALERGRRAAPRPETVALLGNALSLSATDRVSFIASARGREATGSVAAQAPEGTGEEASAPPSPPLLTLPTPPTVLIGRERDEAAVTHLLLQGGARVLTLAGPGGVGKTRLALAVATALRDAYADGVVFVDLSALREAALVTATIAQAVGVGETGGQRVGNALVVYLRDRHMLLILDNFEQVVAAAPLIIELVAACPRLAVLVTSRMALRVRAEQLVRVAPLAVPDQTRTPRELAGYPSVRLFVERARAILPDFDLDAGNATAVAEICQQLDGLPLAIELAAARVALLPPPALLARLERRLAVLTRGAQDAPARQRTLRAAIDWSYDLLAAEEQTLFRRLSVFAGDASLDAIEAICDPDGQLDSVATLSALLEENLVRRGEDGGGGEPRLAMLETIREYALERLEDAGEGEATRQAHAAYYLAIAEAAGPRLMGPEQAAWLVRVDREHANLRAALGCAWERGQGEIGLRLAAALWTFWHIRGYLSEGRAWLERLLAPDARDPRTPPAVVAAALTGAGWLAQAQDDYAAAVPVLEQSVAVRRSVGLPDGLTDLLVARALWARAAGEYARAVTLLEEAVGRLRAAGNHEGISRGDLGLALFRLGMVLRERGDLARATPLYEECLALHRAAGDREGVAIALLGLGDIARDRGDVDRVRVSCEESRAIFEDLGDRWGAGFSLNNLALAAYGGDDLERAAALAEQSVAVFRDLGVAPNIAEALTTLGRVLAARGEVERARATLVESLALASRSGPRYLLPSSLEVGAALAAMQGHAAAAARLLGGAEAFRAAIDTPLPLVFGAAHERTVAAVRAMLGDDAVAAAWAAGRALTQDRAVGEAVAYLGG